MYYWKSWRDRKYRFIALLVFTVVFTTAMTVAAVSRMDPAHPGKAVVAYTSDPTAAKATWAQLTMILGPLAFFANVSALMLGAGGIADEYTQRTMEFVMTRPKPRRYFVWAGWNVGLQQVLIIMIAGTLTAMSFGAYVTHTIAAWKIPLSFPLLLPAMLTIYGLAYLMSVLTRNPRTGMTVAILILLVYNLGEQILQMQYHVVLPSWWITNLVVWGRFGSVPYPFAGVIGWTALAMLLPYAAQKVMEIRDV